MDFETIVRGLRDSNYELNNESRLVRAGLKAEQNTAAIVERYAWLYSPEALAEVDAAAGEAEKRVYVALLQGLIERRTAAAQDRLLGFYARAEAQVGGEKVQFFTALARLAVEPEPKRREEIGEALSRVIEEADELTLEINRTAMTVLREQGHESYIRFWSELKQVDYSALQSELERVRTAAAPLYRGWIEPRLERCGHGFGSTPQFHQPYLRGLAEHDLVYTKERFEPTMRTTFARLGLELFRSPAIHLDLSDRPGKNPRASVSVPEAGREVHLLVRPAGGNHDYAAFLHEAGHALHFGLTDPQIGWPLANLSRSMAYPELWSFLIEGIGRDPLWLQEALGVPAEHVQTIAADLTGVHLMMFTRYTAKLAYELELFGGDPLDRERGRRLYHELPSRTTGFAYDERWWQYDRDDAFYSADYLRAWLAQADVERRLRQRFGERWWADPAAGAWLQRQWSRGCEPEAEETVAELGGRPGSGEALLAMFRERLEGVGVG